MIIVPPVLAAVLDVGGNISEEVPVLPSGTGTIAGRFE